MSKATDWTGLDGAFVAAHALVARDERLEPEDRRHYLERLAALAALPPAERVIVLAPMSVHQRGSRVYENTSVESQLRIEIEEDVIGPLIGAARRLGAAPEVVAYAEAHAGERALDEWVRRFGSALARPALRRHVLSHPDNVVVHVGTSVLTWLGLYHRAVLDIVNEGGRWSLQGVTPGVEATAGAGPRYALVRASRAGGQQPWPRVLDLGAGTYATPERYDDGKPRRLVRIDDEGAVIATSDGQAHHPWATLLWHPLPAA